PAQPDALRSEAAGVGGIGPGVGVRPHAHASPADLVGPSEDGGELRRRSRRRQGDLTEDDLSAGAVEGDRVALGHGHTANGEPGARDSYAFGADDGGLAPPTGHHGGVADQPAA